MSNGLRLQPQYAQYNTQKTGNNCHFVLRCLAQTPYESLVRAYRSHIHIALMHTYSFYGLSTPNRPKSPNFRLISRNLLFRDRSLFMAGVGAEEKMVGTQKNMLPHLPLGQILLHPTLERQQKKSTPHFFTLG